KRHPDPESRRGLQPAGVVAAALVRDMLSDVSDRASILAAQAQPLDHPQEEEEEGSRQPRRFVGRYQSDASRADAHASQGDEEGVLAADSIAQPSEEECAQRTDQEPGREQ